MSMAGAKMTLKHIAELMDVHALTKTLMDFSEATGFATVAVDARGVPVTQLCAFADFCRQIRQDPVRRALCHGCDAYGGLQSLTQGSPQIYRCHAGLVDFSVPITSDGDYVGAILCGQTRVPEVEQPEFLMDGLSWRGEPTLEHHYEQVPVVGRRKVQAATKTLLGLRAGLETDTGTVRLLLSDMSSHHIATRESGVQASSSLLRGRRSVEASGAPGGRSSADHELATLQRAPQGPEDSSLKTEIFRAALVGEDLAAVVAEISRQLDAAYMPRAGREVVGAIVRIEDALLAVGSQIAPSRAAHLRDSVLHARHDERPCPSRYVSQLQLERVAIVLLDEVLDSRPPRQRNVRDLINDIARHPARALSLTDAARTLHWSPGHLSKLFKSVTGETFVSYVMARRLERAELMLASTQMPVGEIAIALDFTQVNYFSRVFRTRTGISPSEYRREHESCDRRLTNGSVQHAHLAPLRG